MPNPYDQTPWGGAPCPSSHPDSVGAIARLFGLEAAPANACRVLELGCAAGANLIPMAAAFPESDFVGLDLSAGQIDAGRAEVAALGLTNVSLRVGDLAALPADLGRFDFVLAHGVFSWVAPEAQEGLLRGVRTCLAEQGVAFVSYAALPGAYPRLALAQMMRWHVRDERAPGVRVERARRFAEFVARNVEDRAPQAPGLRRLVGEMGGLSDAHVLHDYLAETFAPTSLSTFVGRAGAHRLQYLGDAQFDTMFGDGVAGDTLDGIREHAADQLAFEQALDFVGHRPFRTSLLCRAERTLDRALGWERLEGLFVSSRSLRTDGPWTFRTPSGDDFDAGSPLVGRAFDQLAGHWPRPTGFDALSAHASPDERAALGQNLLAAFAGRQLALGTTDRGICDRVSEAPRAFAFARAQAARGKASVTDLWHQSVELDGTQRALLVLLDGSRSHAELGAALSRDAAWVQDPLASLQRAALLVG